MLAYVFWHTSRLEVAVQEANLFAFHETLAANPPDGFIRSVVFSTDSLPWTPEGRSVYEDWYLIDDFAALGQLNEAAVRGARRDAHNAAAKGADWGAAGLYLLHSGSFEPETAEYATWMAKGEGRSYEDFYASIPGDTAVWRRQLVLSCGPEFCLQSSNPGTHEDAIVRRLTPIWIGR